MPSTAIVVDRCQSQFLCIDFCKKTSCLLPLPSQMSKVWGGSVWLLASGNAGHWWDLCLSEREKQPRGHASLSFLPTIEIDTLEQLQPGPADLHLLVGRWRQGGGGIAYVWLERSYDPPEGRPWTGCRHFCNSYPIHVFHLSFNFLCLVLL